MSNEHNNCFKKILFFVKKYHGKIKKIRMNLQKLDTLKVIYLDLGEFGVRSNNNHSTQSLRRRRSFQIFHHHLHQQTEHQT